MPTLAEIEVIKALTEEITKLQTQHDALRQQYQTLQVTLHELELRIAKTPIRPISPSLVDQNLAASTVIVELLLKQTAYSNHNRTLENQNAIMSNMIELHPYVTPPPSPTQDEAKRSHAQMIPGDHEPAASSAAKRPRPLNHEEQLKALLAIQARHQAEAP